MHIATYVCAYVQQHLFIFKPYTVFVDSTDAVGTLQVRSSQSVDSLVENVRKEFSESLVKSLSSD